MTENNCAAETSNDFYFPVGIIEIHLRPEFPEIMVDIVLTICEVQFIIKNVSISIGPEYVWVRLPEIEGEPVIKFTDPKYQEYITKEIHRFYKENPWIKEAIKKPQ